eukprot:jgi/Bigna1/91685/estExt_fgenesh1_pg.C_1130016
MTDLKKHVCRAYLPNSIKKREIAVTYCTSASTGGIEDATIPSRVYVLSVVVPTKDPAFSAYYIEGGTKCSEILPRATRVAFEFCDCGATNLESQSGSLIGKKRAGDKIGCAPHAPAPLRMKVDPDHKSRREVHCDEVIGKTMMSQKQMHEAAKNNGMERLIGAAIGKMPRNPPPEVLPNVSMESFHPFGVDNAEGNNAITYKSILTLEPEKFAEVSNMNTYLYVNGHRSKDVIRVSRRIKDTQPYHGERIEFERPGLLVSFSRFNAFAQILKKISKNTVYMCGKIMLKCNSPIKTVELLNKQGLQIKGKNYPARLYPLSYSSTALSSRHAGEKPRTHRSEQELKT